MTTHDPSAATWEGEVRRLITHGRDAEAASLAARSLRARTESGTTTSPRGDSMDPLTQLDEVGTLLGTVVGTIDEDQLDDPTPCAGFRVRDVLGHMIGGATMFAAAYRGEQASPPADPAADPLPQFGPALGGLVQAISAPGALERTVASPFGDAPGADFARYVALDGLVHGWDLAQATGQPYAPSDALVAEVDSYAHAAVTPEMRATGAFGPPVEPPADADPMTRLAAFTGRQV